MSITVKQILVYPIKGLDACEVKSSEVTSGGSLMFDRMIAMKNPDGKYINGKKNDKVYKLRSSYNLENLTVTLHHGEYIPETFSLTGDLHRLNDYLDDYFETNVTLLSNTQNGFPDDTDAPGPTVSLYESYELVASWFPGLTADDILRRFRCNIILQNAPAFREDILLPADEGGEKAFSIGNVQLLGINACARCVVPSKDPVTGDIYPQFQKSFAELRKDTLPSWAPAGAFDHFYRFTVNTKIPLSEKGKIISVGDSSIFPES